MKKSVKVMKFDAHVHVGYFPRKDGKGGDAYYYSPARLLRYMQWAGVKEFIFSSTNACWDCHAETMHPEAAEVLRLAKQQGIVAHPFFWISMDYFLWDSNLEKMPAFYEGIKLHGVEAHWPEHPDALRHILSIAAKRHLPVQIHSSRDDENGCATYFPFCRDFPNVRIDLAHGNRTDDAIKVLQECPNVWVDTSFMMPQEVERVWMAAPERVMYGSDFPAPLRYWDKSCTYYMRDKIRREEKLGGEKIMFMNAMAFIKGERLQ